MLQEITLRAIDDFFRPINSPVDELGMIDRQIKQLEAEARKLKAELIEKGAGKYYGKVFCAEVQHYDRATISPILVKEFGTKEFVEQVTQVKPIDAVVVKPL